MHERRGIRRWQILHPARVQVEGAQNAARCHVSNVSLKGMQLCLPFALHKDAFMKLKVELSEDCCFEAQVWISWVKCLGNTYAHGIYFNSLSDDCQSKIYAFMRRQFPQLLADDAQGKDTQRKGEEAMEDKRIFARFPVNMRVQLLDLKSNQEASAQTVDVSAKGVGIMTNYSLEPNNPLELWLHVPDNGQPLYSRGQVVWTKQTGHNEYRAGINLDRADLMGLSRIMRS